MVELSARRQPETKGGPGWAFKLFLSACGKGGSMDIIDLAEVYALPCCARVAQAGLA